MNCLPRFLSGFLCARLRQVAVFVLLPLMAAGPTVARCSLWVPDVGTGQPIVDGSIGSTEWTSASVTVSGSGCFSAFHDGSKYAPESRVVKVYALQNATGIYLGFRVEDQTPNPGNIVRQFGEQIFVQYAPEGGTGTVGATKLIITNIRGASWPIGRSEQFSLANSSGTGWATPSDGLPSGVEVAIVNSTAGYEMELKIPKSASSVRYNLAFAVINDIGTPSGETPAISDAWDAHFPGTLTIETIAVCTPDAPANCLIADPANPVGSPGWKNQSEWAIASSAITSEITIQPDPATPWISDDIDVLNCNDPDDATGDRYNYYASAPCSFRVKVSLTNSGATIDYRSILVVVSNAGMGQVAWQVVDFGEKIGVPPGRSVVLITKNRLPQAGITTTGHPCIRVYVLPASLDQNTKDKLNIANESGGLLDEANDLRMLVNTYQLDVSMGDVGKQVGQQNISIAEDAVTCPESCPAAALQSPPRAVAVAWSNRATTGAKWARLAALAGDLPQQEVTTTGASQWGTGVLARLQRRYGRDYVIVFVSAFFYDTVPSVRPPAYRIVRPLGGVTQLFPVRALMRDPRLPVHFDVGNPTDRERTVFLKADVLYPPGSGYPSTSTITLPSMRLAPGETKRVDFLEPPSRTAKGRIAMVAGMGATLPHGSFSNTYDGRFSGTVGVEYGLAPSQSLEAAFAAHRFSGTGGAADIDVLQFSVNAKAYFWRLPFRPFIAAGVGSYAFDPGSTRFGYNAGVGFDYEIVPRWAFEGRLAYHRVTGNAPNSNYSTVMVGARYAF